MIDLFVTRIF